MGNDFVPRVTRRRARASVARPVKGFFVRETHTHTRTDDAYGKDEHTN